MASFTTDLNFLTQEQSAWNEPDVVSPSVISETPFETSGHHSITSPWSFQDVILTTAPPSHRSDEQIERSENRCQSELDHDLSFPRAESLDARASRSDVNKADRAAEEHPPVLNDDPLGKLYATVDELLSKGLRLAVVYQSLDNHYLNRSNTPYSKLSTAKHIFMVHGDDFDLEEHSAGESLGKADTSSKPAKADGGNPAKQVAAWEVSDEASETETGISKPADLRKLSIHDEFTFHRAFEACNFQAIGVGASAINLLDLAHAAVDVNRQNRERTTTDEETWQLLFNIIANLLVFGLKPLHKTVEALSRPSTSGAPAANLPGPENGYRPSAANQRLGITEDEEALERLTESMCSWMAEDPSSALIKVCSYYDKLQTVYQYDEMTKPENRKRTNKLLARKGIRLGRGKKKVSTAILRYISQQLRNAHIQTTVENLSAKISNFRPVCALVEAFGQGVLVLLGANPRKFLNRVEKGSAKGATYFYHERLRDVAVSLKKADRHRYQGQLRALFTDLRKKVLGPALRFRKHKRLNGWLIDDGRVEAFESVEIGWKIPFILGGISRRRGPVYEQNNKAGVSEDGELGKDGSESGTDHGEKLYLP